MEDFDMTKIKILYVLTSVLFLISCTSNDDSDLINGIVCDDKIMLCEGNYHGMNNREIKQGGLEHLYVEEKEKLYNPNFSDINGSLLGNTIFTVLTISDSDELFIATDLGGFGELYHINYGAGDLYLNRMEFNFMHSISSYVYRNGIRIESYVNAFPNIVKGFYRLGGEYFFLTGTWELSLREAGAIGRLVKNDSDIFDIEGNFLGGQRKWYVEKYMTLPGSPYTFFQNNDKLFIVTRNQILLVHGERVTILIDNVNWNGRPNAMDKINDKLFIRTDQGVWLYNLEMDLLNFNPN